MTYSSVKPAKALPSYWLVASVIAVWNVQAKEPALLLEPGPAVVAAIQDESDEEEGFDLRAEPAPVIQASALLQPPLQPRVQSQPAAPSGGAPRSDFSGLSRSTLGAASTSQAREFAGVGQSRLANPASSTVLGSEAANRAATDAASILNRAPGSTGIDVQRRTPIVSDPRIRGGRVGQLAVSGSYWIPARMDLDTAPSKLDSRAVQEIIAIKGPYSALFGPQVSFLEADLLNSPRFDGSELFHGQTSYEYKTNGEQMYGRQVVQGGDTDWGYRLAYGHRTGNDYYTGSGLQIPASYNSRDLDAVFGADLNEGGSIEFHYLRLDQTGLEFPGQAFDIDYLVTDAWELEHVADDLGWCHKLSTEGWYNRTRFEGSAQRPGKRRQFPFFDQINFNAVTDADAASMGYKSLASWGDEEEDRLILGVDLRHVKQELNEIASGDLQFISFFDANSPIPRSASTNPGFLAERSLKVGETTQLRGGGRLDYYHAGFTGDLADYAAIGPQQLPLTDVLGTTDLERDLLLWSLFLTSQWEVGEDVYLTGGIGHGERPPNLTELFVAQSFMFLLQNGANTVTGDPSLRPERYTQFDLGAKVDGDRLRGRLGGYFIFAQDFITFESLSVVDNPVFLTREQINLKFVNTRLATFLGTEGVIEYDLTDWLQPFATLQYVEGTDLTRNGRYATLEAQPGQASMRVDNLPRGYFSGLAAGNREPLPGTMPLQSRIGLRWHQVEGERPWQIELSTLLAASQYRVAESLGETPTAGYAVVDLRARWQYSKSLMLFGGVENLTDTNYREHLDFRSPRGLAVYQPGINLYASAHLNY